MNIIEDYFTADNDATPSNENLHDSNGGLYNLTNQTSGPVGVSDVDRSYIRFEGRDVIVNLSSVDLDRAYVPENTTKLTISGSSSSPVSPYLPNILKTVSNSLVSLDLTYAGLRDLPDLTRLTSCRELNVSYNPLHVLMFYNLPPALQTLRADHCKLESLSFAHPSVISKPKPPKYLRALSLRNNFLSSLPSHLCLFRYLRYLHLENNAFSGHWLEIVALLDPNEQRRRRDLIDFARSQYGIPSSRPISTASDNDSVGSNVTIMGRSRSRSIGSMGRLRKKRSNSQLTREGRSFSNEMVQPPMPISSLALQHSISSPYMTSLAATSVPTLVRTSSSSAAVPNQIPIHVEDTKTNYRRRSGSVGSHSAGTSTAQARWGFLKKIVGVEDHQSSSLRIITGNSVDDSSITNKTFRARVNGGSVSRLNLQAAADSSLPPPLPLSATSSSILSPALSGFSALNSPMMMSPGMSDNDMERMRPDSDTEFSPTMNMAPLYQGLQAAIEVVPPSTITKEQEDAELARRGVAQVMEYLSDVWDLEGHKSRWRRHRRKTNEDDKTRTGDTEKKSRRNKSSTNAIEEGKTGGVMSQGSIDSSADEDEGGASFIPTQPEKKIKDDPYKRYNIISEILSTEKTYVSGLKELLEIYIQSQAAQQFQNAAMQTAGQMAVAEERRIIFSNMENLTAFHRDHFLPALESAVSKAKATMMVGTNEEGSPGVSIAAAEEIGQIFCQFAAWMKMYSVYINNFDGACTLLSRWTSLVAMPSSNLPSSFDLSPLTLSSSETLVQHRKRVKHYFQKCKTHPLHTQMNLQSYLLLPVQRIPRYKMLLQDLLANSQRSPESANNVPANEILEWLPRASKQMEALATEMNERKRESEGRAKLVEWQSRIKGRFRSPLVQPHRRLVLDGKLVLTKIVRKKTLPPSINGGGGTVSMKMDLLEQEVWGLVCSDVFVVLTDSSVAGSLNGTVPGDTMELVTVLRLDARFEPAKVSKGQNLLRVYDEQAVMYFRCKDEDEALRWRKAINVERW